MIARVVDTNVAITANGGAPQVSAECQVACIEVLEDLVRSGLIVIDDRDLIMDEYQRYLSHSGQPGVGDLFFKHLFVSQFDVAKVERVAITPLEGDLRLFDEFPDDDRLAPFDPNDRKFVAAARASRNKPQILNASDSDWTPVTEILAAYDVVVRQLCPDDLKAP